MKNEPRISKIVVLHTNGSGETYYSVDHYYESDGFLSITTKFKSKDSTSNMIFTNICKINLSNIVSYTICIDEEDEDNG